MQLTGDATHCQRLCCTLLLVPTYCACCSCPQPPADTAAHPAADDGDSLQVAVVWKNKTPTRLPEALWWSFRPHPRAVNPDTWRLHKLNSHIHPHEVS